VRNKKRNRFRAMWGNPAWCSLCGLAIPAQIVSPSHPLFGTIDHTIPRSKNGPDRVSNRAPAHRLCNERKGNAVIDPEEFAAERHKEVIPLLESFGRKIRRRDRLAAIRRVIAAWAQARSNDSDHLE
jgi:5-methylcytosine-specific restriction endonuclease McrA